MFIMTYLLARPWALQSPRKKSMGQSEQSFDLTNPSDFRLAGLPAPAYNPGVCRGPANVSVPLVTKRTKAAGEKLQLWSSGSNRLAWPLAFSFLPIRFVVSAVSFSLSPTGYHEPSLLPSLFLSLLLCPPLFLNLSLHHSLQPSSCKANLGSRNRLC